MATIKDIAQRAGVSFTTVSNVIHGNAGRVSAATVEKIQRIMKELDYVPNMGARGLKGGTSHLVGVIFGHPVNRDKNALQDPFISELFGALEQELRRAGYFMLLYAAEGSEDIAYLARTWNVDGLVLLGMDAAEGLALRGRTSRPLVFIDTYFPPGGPAAANVGLDDEAGGYRMGRYLLSCGHRRIAFLTDNPGLCGEVDRHRYLGLQRALREAGEGACHSQVLYLSPQRERRRRELAALLPRLGEFTALFFASDFYAADALDFLAGQGVEVPADVSVAGFDDNYFARLVRPRLTTVRQDVAHKGALAARLLLRMLAGEAGAPGESLCLPVELVVRDSVRSLTAPPGGAP